MGTHSDAARAAQEMSDKHFPRLTEWQQVVAQSVVSDWRAGMWPIVNDDDPVMFTLTSPPCDWNGRGIDVRETTTYIGADPDVVLKCAEAKQIVRRITT